MTEAELSRILKTRYSQAADTGKVVAIHLFGIEFADALDGRDLKSTCAGAGVPQTHATEIRKCVRLAEHVELKRK